jgi:hypothetical protein
MQRSIRGCFDQPRGWSGWLECTQQPLNRPSLTRLKQSDKRRWGTPRQGYRKGRLGVLDHKGGRRMAGLMLPHVFDIRSRGWRSAGGVWRRVKTGSLVKSSQGACTAHIPRVDRCDNCLRLSNNALGGVIQGVCPCPPSSCPRSALHDDVNACQHRQARNAGQASQVRDCVHARFGVSTACSATSGSSSSSVVGVRWSPRPKPLVLF